jgi:hypothetical protein
MSLSAAKRPGLCLSQTKLLAVHMHLNTNSGHTTDLGFSR